jgi:hypothetical protein
MTGALLRFMALSKRHSISDAAALMEKLGSFSRG